MDPKELYIQEHERLIEEYVETYGEHTRHEAYDLCADAAYDAMRDRFAERADWERKRRQEEGN